MKEIIFFAVLAFSIQSTYSQTDPFLSLPRPSQAASVSQRIGMTDITIRYSSPKVAGRKVWGEMVPYNEGDPYPWRAGANENTTITITDPVKISGKKLNAGTYGIHMIPSENYWTIIFSNTNTAWGSFDYNSNEDALRITVTPEETPYYEWLTYEFPEKGDNYVVASLSWEKKRVSFGIEVDVHKIAFSRIKEQLRDLRQFYWEPWYYAAQYSFDNDIDLSQGLEWVEVSISNEENFNNLKMKSDLLKKMGKTEESKRTLQIALNHHSVDSETLYQYGRSLIRKGKFKEAMSIYELNAKRYSKSWLAEHGLARAYSAIGEYKKALILEKKALTKAPEINRKAVLRYIGHLEKNEDFNKF